MKKTQQVMLTILLVMLTPCAVLALLLALGALSGAISGRDVSAAAIAVPLLLIGSSLPILALLLLRRLSNLGYEKQTRRLLFWFYCGVMLYCGLWAASPIRKGEMTYSLFSPEQFVVVVIILASPAVFTMLTKEEIRNEK